MSGRSRLARRGLEGAPRRAIYDETAEDGMAGELGRGVKRGVSGRCPNCGEGRLFRAYLKVEPTCPACGHDNAQYPADDAPAYVTILLVGHLVVAPLLAFSFILTWPIWLVLGTTLPALAGLTLVLLPRVKGAVIGFHWAQGVKGEVRSDEEAAG